MSGSSETVKSQIFASNDITKTNPLCLNLSKRKFAKRVNKKHTSYTTNIGGIIKSHPHKFLVDNYIMKKIQIQKILFLIESLKKEERIRNQLTEKINELSSFENKASKNITTTVILKELQERLTEGHNNHQQAIEQFHLSYLHSPISITEFQPSNDQIIFHNFLGKQLLHKIRLNPQVE